MYHQSETLVNLFCPPAILKNSIINKYECIVCVYVCVCVCMCTVCVYSDYVISILFSNC